MEISEKGKPQVKIEQDTVSIIYSCENPVLEKIRQFKDKSLYCDVVLSAKPNKNVRLKKKQRKGYSSQIKAHSCVLAAGSTFFQKLFCSNSSEKNHFLSDIVLEHLKTCVNFLYRRNVVFPFNKIDDVIQTAKSLEICELEFCCMSAKTEKETAHIDSIEEKIDNNPDKLIKGETIQSVESRKKELELSNELDMSTIKQEAELTNDEHAAYDTFEDDNSNNEENNDAYNNIDELHGQSDLNYNEYNNEDSANEIKQQRKISRKNDLKSIVPEELLGKSFYCPHHKELYSVSQHYCSIIKREMRLRLCYKCQVCKEVVSSAHLSRHRKKHPHGNDGKPIFILERKISGNKFYCRFCEQTFDCGYHFCSARNKKVRLRPRIVCQYCGVELSGDSFIKHLENVHTVKPHQCEYCGNISESKEEHHEHLLTHYTGKTFTCDLCGKVYRGPHSLSAHKLKVHNVVKPRKRFKNDSIFKCPDCDFENYSSTLVCLHIVKDHKKSDSEDVRRFISVYNKKKCGNKEAIAEFKSLQSIIKKREPSNSAENDIKQELYSDIVQSTNKTTLKRKRSVGKKQKKTEVKNNNVMMMSESGTSESYYSMIKFNDTDNTYTLGDPSNVVILTEASEEITNANTNNMVTFHDHKSIIGEHLLSDNHTNTVVISGGDQFVQFRAPNESISLIETQGNNEVNEMSDCKNVILRIIEDGQVSVSMEEEVVGENIEVVSEINTSDLQSGSIVSGDIQQLRLVTSAVQMTPVQEDLNNS